MWRHVVILMVIGVSMNARAQSRPFFGQGVVAFDPEISVTESGNRIQPRVVTATPDLKHVRMGVGGGSVKVNDIHTFNFEIPERPLGFVGGVNPTASASMSKGEDSSVLNRRGMFFLSGP